MANRSRNPPPSIPTTLALCEPAARLEAAPSNDIIDLEDNPGFDTQDSDIILLEPASALQILDLTASSALPSKPVEHPCPGYKLVIPDGGSPYSSYPFLIHTKHVVPWQLQVVKQDLILYSTSCSGIAGNSNQSGASFHPCSYCAHLHNHNMIMGIRHRNLDGAHEMTPWQYLTPAHMLSLLQRKTNQNNLLKLRLLKAAGKISHRNRHLDAWKRLSIAVGREEIPRLRALIAAEHRRGGSIFTILDKIDRAARRVYHPRGYERADFQRAFLIYKLGGFSTHRIVQRTLGVPSIDATKRHIVTVPLTSSPAIPTSTEIRENLSICYPPPNDLPNQAGGPITGMTMQVDEIKIQERLRWDPCTNMILGICREHGQKCVLEFRTITQAEEIQRLLISKHVHLATEHVLKRFRNTSTRAKGFLLDGVAISSSVIKAHLISNGMDTMTADSLLMPNDKQDVVLMIKLLYAISSLTDCGQEESPSVKATRRVLRLLGRVYFNLLQPYLNTTLSLDDQLSHLSTAAHLILALYNRDKGNFIPVQLYFDVMSMIKNVYFCVAKAQIDNPQSCFYIILLGTDGLEKVFGIVRTMISNDSHVDQLQLTNRIDGAVQCAKILQEHPEWGGESRRLRATPLPNTSSDVTSSYDHINPASMTGDLKVENIILQSCWQRGRRVAEEILKAAKIMSPFEWMEHSGDYDILCPFGNNKMILVDGLLAGEREETDEERGDSIDALLHKPAWTLSNPSVPDTVPDSLSKDDGPDIDDLSGELELDASKLVGTNTAWVAIDSDAHSKKVHKASILRIFSSGLSASDSKDRLKRVRGYSQYNETTNCATVLAPDPDNPVEVRVEDPALVLVRCCGAVFLGLFQVLSIRVNSSYVQSLSTNLIHEPNVQFYGQIMTLKAHDISYQSDGPDWEWNGTYEAKSVFWVDGKFVELMDPEIMRSSTLSPDQSCNTYAFSTLELREFAAMMYEKHLSELWRLPEVHESTTYPYRTAEGGQKFFSIFSHIFIQSLI
ncbi:hypothetical protein C0992_005594 [Termitomyces sp. T32_za158]|nr:hypothetical protein C0992_005594 [Termitomyces sp. T32_za158]